MVLFPTVHMVTPRTQSAVGSLSFCTTYPEPQTHVHIDTYKQMYTTVYNLFIYIYILYMNIHFTFTFSFYKCSSVIQIPSTAFYWPRQAQVVCPQRWPRLSPEVRATTLELQRVKEGKEIEKMLNKIQKHCNETVSFNWFIQSSWKELQQSILGVNIVSPMGIGIATPMTEFKSTTKCLFEKSQR